MDKETLMVTSLTDVLKSALSRYDYTSDSQITLINVSENTTFRLDDPQTGRSAAIRIHRPDYHSAREIESELIWMDALREAGVVDPPRPILTCDGARMVTVPSEGVPRHVVLFEWMGGHTPNTDGDLVPSFNVLGTLAAKMHRHSASWIAPTSFERYRCDYDAGLGQRAMWGRWQNGLGIGESERAILGRLDAELKYRLEQFGYDIGRFGLAHNDLRLANLLLDGKDIHVIDFDDCGFAWYMYDFATAVSFLEDDRRVPEWMDAWVSGYRKVSPLSQSDLDFIPTMIMFRRLLLLGWVGSHHEYAQEAADLGVDFTNGTCALADRYLSGSLYP